MFKTLQEDPALLTDTAGKGSAGSANGGGGGGDGKAAGTSGTSAPMELCAARAASQRRTLQNGVRAVCSVLADLYSRWARRPFSSAALWEISVSFGLLKASFRTPSASQALVIALVSYFALACHRKCVCRRRRGGQS